MEKEKRNRLFTGERFIPGIEDDKLQVEHYQRYMSVRNLVKDKVVLDAACGEGYGSHIIASVARDVTGIDIDRATIDRAKVTYGKQHNLHFLQGSIADIPIENESVDVVVSFETIEHVSERIQHRFLNEIERVLKKDGILIMSTPNKKIYSDLFGYKNQFHIKEFYHNEFLSFLHEKFMYVKLFNQAFQVVSLLNACEGNGGEIAYYTDNQDYIQNGKYYIAVASNISVNTDLFASVYIGHFGEYEENIQRIIALQEEEESRNQHIAELDGKLAVTDRRIAELQDEDSKKSLHIQELDTELEMTGKRIVELQDEDERKNRHIQQLDGELEAAGRRIAELQDENEKKDQHIRKLDGEIEESGKRIVELQGEDEKKNLHIQKLNTQIDALKQQENDSNQKNNELQQKKDQLDQENNELRQKKDQLDRQNNNLIQKNRELDLQIGFQNEQIADLQQIVRNKEGHIELLLEVERRYEHEKTTHAYKIAKKIQKVGNWFLPLNSRRRFFARVIYNIFRHPYLMLRVINPSRIKNYMKYIRLEGMDGVKNRYEEAVDIERMHMDPSSRMDLELEHVAQETAQDRAADEYDRIAFPCCKRPTVSIVIPVYNEFDYTYNCLKSILKNSGDIAYEILIANDCSTDVTRDVEKIVKNVKLITTEKNVGFLLNCNHAAQYAKGKYILFLNNDTQVQTNWLEPLVSLIEQDEKVGMVGSKLVYPDGYLQEAGGILWKDASAWNYGNRKSPEDPEYNYVKEVDYISGAAIMIRKDLWKAIGGFDERFVPAYCEDSDLAFEVRKHGYKVMYQPLSLVVHFEGVSNGTDLNSGLKAHQVENQQKFFEKWKSVLEAEHFNNAEKVFLARDRSRDKRILLMVDHYVPQYDKDAGSRTVFQYLRMFRRKGFHVKFIGDNFYKHEPYTTVLQQMGIEVLYGPYYAQNWEKWVRENGEFFSFVFLNRPHISVKYIDFVRNNTKAKIIYYGHDLHFLREMRKYELTKNKKALTDSADWKVKELELMRKADIVYYPSNVEVQEIAKIDATINVKAITAYIFDGVISQKYQFDKRKDFMFVGGFVHTPNVDAVLWFTNEILPKIVDKLSDIKFYIVGSNPTLEIQELASDNIIVKGFVSDEELIQLYKNCRISIVPLRYGAGIKGKVVEAMRYGIPVITTTVGAEGIAGAEQILCIEDDAEQMADRFVQLYYDRAGLETMSKDSYAYIRNNFSEESAWRIIAKDFS